MSIKGGQTIGYHYLGSVLFGIGRGPVNCLTHIKVADKIVWEGGSGNNNVFAINQPDIFGGEKQEGGIQGLARNFMGKPDQVLPGASPTTHVGDSGPYKSGILPSVKALLGGRCGEFRGRHMLWYDGLLSSMNPYIKEWSFRRWRTTAGWHNDAPWYQAKATIYLNSGKIRAMNPAHIIYQTITDPAWGGGRPVSELNEASFVLAANTFCDEQFGLCFHWQRTDAVGKFIQTVIDHCGAVVYTDRETGLINLKLIRGDYDPALIPHFTLDSGLLSITEDDSSSSEGMADEIIVEGLDPITNQTIEGRSHNLAVRRFRNGASTIKQSYPGLPTTDLCNRVAERDRNSAAAGLRKFTVVLDRAGFKIHPGAVFKITYAPRGIAGMVLRAGDIDDGNMINGQITIKCVQDVFSMPLISYITPVDNTWVDPSVPAPAYGEIVEPSYRDLYRKLSSTDLAAVGAGDSYVAVLASSPSGTSYVYDLIVKVDSDPSYGSGQLSSFTANGTVAGDLHATTTVITLENLVGWDDPTGLMAYVDGEYMAITAWDETLSQVTVKRGCVDTWPREHLSGVRFWVIDDDAGSDGHLYSEGDVIDAKVLSRTSSGILAEADASVLSTTLVGRAFRPYPPADVKVDTLSIFAVDHPGFTAEPVLAFVERNRITEADAEVGFFEATVSAEAGTTYEIDILDVADYSTVVNTYTITSPWTYTTADQTTDGVDTWPLLPVRLYSKRDGVRSLTQDWFYLRGDKGGYGMNYGNNYGGDCP